MSKELTENKAMVSKEKSLFLGKQAKQYTFLIYQTGGELGLPINTRCHLSKVAKIKIGFPTRAISFVSERIIKANSIILLNILPEAQKSFFSGFFSFLVVLCVHW